MTHNIRVFSYAERFRDAMCGEIGFEDLSHALTQNINHSLILLVYEAD